MKQCFSICAIISFTILGIIGCESEDPASNNTNAKVYANAGSTFDFVAYDKDTNYQKIDGSDTTWRDTVTTGPDSVDGKSKVITALRGNGDTLIMAYETNGDISINFPNGLTFAGISLPDVGKGWWTVPFGSGKTNDTLFSQMTSFEVVFGGTPITLPVKINIVANSLAPSTYTLNGKSYDVKRATVTIYASANFGIITDRMTVQQEIHFAPELGYFTTIDRTVLEFSNFIDMGNDGGRLEALIAFSLK
jgi:hypothetical protein